MRMLLPSNPPPRKQILYAMIWLFLLGGTTLKSLVGQADDAGMWRRTTRGWEQAHAVQSASTTIVLPENFTVSSLPRSANKVHGILLPISAGCFMLTFGSWALLSIENRAIKRRL